MPRDYPGESPGPAQAPSCGNKSEEQAPTSTTVPLGESSTDWSVSTVIAATEYGAHYYALGRAHGYQEGYEDAQQDAHARRVNARIARAGVEAIDVVAAREKAAQRSGVEPAGGRRSA